MSKLIWLLRLFASIWTGFAALLIAFGSVAIVAQRGWSELSEVFDPFNFWNTAMVILVFMPAFIANSWASALKERQPLSEEEANKLVKEYGIALQRRIDSPPTEYVSLPASKERIKEALRFAAASAMRDTERLGVLGAGYIMLSDFQSLATTMDVRMAEMHALKSEWDAWLRKSGVVTQ